MTMLALGRAFNAIPIGDNVYANVRDAGGVGFLCFLAAGAGDTYTLTEAKTAAGGSAQVLATMDRYYTNTGNGTDAWTERTQAAASTVVTAAAATQNCMYVQVDAAELSDGFKFLKLASTGAGLVTILTVDLRTQRAPQNLPALGV